MLIIDRIEEDFAVCELVLGKQSPTRILIPLEKLPEEVKAGDVLARNGKEYIIDVDETKKRREEIIKLQNSLWE